MGVETTLRTPNRPATPAMTDDSPLTFCLPAVSRKKVTAAFDGGRLSSDSGVILLSLAGRRRAIARTLAALIDDPRDPAHITHTVEDVLSARMLAIACGYPDGNDFHFLRSDPAFKLACGRLPDTGADLCSQATVSRWENAPTLKEIVRLTYALIDIWCKSYRKPPASVVLDIDDTLDIVHGHQKLAEWNAHYDERCFLPIHIYDTATGRPVAVILRPGKTPSGKEVRGWLRRLMRRIRQHWPNTRITIRGDSHYGRWSVRSMGRHAGLSHSTVQRIWAKNELKPHLIKTLKLSNDPKFEEKFWDVIGLYLDPPAKALVLCCDEKSQCQALERTQLGLPLAPKLPRTRTHDYTRHGTVTLFA